MIVRELDTAEHRSSTSTLTVSVVDVNDNAPRVTSDLLTTTVPEGNYEGGTGQFLVSVSSDALPHFFSHCESSRKKEGKREGERDGKTFHVGVKISAQIGRERERGCCVPQLNALGITQYMQLYCDKCIAQDE